ELVGKTPVDVLTRHRVYKETESLKAEYQQRRDEFQDIIDHGFGKQYLFTGQAIRTEDFRSAKQRTQRKVVHDVAPDEIAPLRMVTASTLFDEGERSEEHTSELQSRFDLVCRLLLEKK